MILRSLAKGALAQVDSTGAAAGLTAVNGASIDMLSYETVVGLALLGALTATQVTYLKAQGSDDNTNWSDLLDADGNVVKTAAAADADSNKLLILDLHRPTHRYVRFVVVRGTANAALTSLLSLRYNGQREPVAQLAAQVSQSAVVPYAA